MPNGKTMSKKSSIRYGIVVGGTFHSERMEFKVRNEMDNGIYCIDMSKDDFKGSLEPALIDDAIKSFRRDSKIRVVRGISFHSGIVPENPVRYSRIPFGVLDPMYDEFEEIEVAILKNGACYFLQSVSTDKGFALMDVRDAFDERRTLDEIKGITPEIRIVFTLHAMERRRQEEEEIRRQEEEIRRQELEAAENRREAAREAIREGTRRRNARAQDQLGAIREDIEASGAMVIDIHAVNFGIEVTWEVEGHRINTLLDNDRRVVDGGFCMSGYDETQSASSIVRVLQDYVNQGDYIHLTRTVNNRVGFRDGHRRWHRNN